MVIWDGSFELFDGILSWGNVQRKLRRTTWSWFMMYDEWFSPTKMRWSKGGWIGDIKVVVTSFNVFGTACFALCWLYLLEESWKTCKSRIGSSNGGYWEQPQTTIIVFLVIMIIRFLFSPSSHPVIFSSSHPSYVIVIGIVDTSTAQRDVKNTNTRTVSPSCARYPQGRALRVVEPWL